MVRVVRVCQYKRSKEREGGLTVMMGGPYDVCWVCGGEEMTLLGKRL